MPATCLRFWIGPVPSAVFCTGPVKQQITLRLDADVVSWFKANVPNGRGYQTEINRVLREHARRALSQA